MGEMSKGEVAARLRALHNSDVGFAALLKELTLATLLIAEYLQAEERDAPLLAEAIESLREIENSLTRLDEFLSPEE